MKDDEKHEKFFDRKLLYYGKVAFVVATAIFISYFTIKNLDTIAVYIAGAVNKFFKVLTPLIIGVVLAFLFNRPVMFFEKFFGKIKIKRSLSIILLYLIIIGAITLISIFIIPGIEKNIIQLTNIDLPDYSNIIVEDFDRLKKLLSSTGLTVDSGSIEKYIARFTNISSVVLGNIMGFIKGLTKGIFNFILAMILSFYILQKKEKILGSIKEVILLFNNHKISDPIIQQVKEFNTILNGYISGVLVDAVIVLIMAMIGLKIIGHKYFLLMGVLVGLLNLIPYFGSIVSTIIAALLALFQGLPEVFYTVVMLVIIQQIDGNIVQPRVIGNKVGLEPLYVITAILVFGSYWGLPGMILAVPFTALIKEILKSIMNRRKEQLRYREQTKNTN
ncbi:MAG: AI-2E family transporter [Clostridiales bacterium]|nr:AI-2E family transporter [Clostridiales bacterium]